MSLFERFIDTKEAGFREDFIKPLLIRLGFIGISNKHGVNEFGKDYVFSEIDGFGHLRHLVVQAKHLRKIDQGPQVDKLVSQIEQCFYTPYTLPSAPAEMRYVSRVYVFNTGDITDNAERQIRDRLKKEFVANTHLYGGSQLEIVVNASTYRTALETRIRLQGLLIQLDLNIKIWDRLLQGIKPDQDWDKQVFEARGSILHGLEDLLSRPLLPDRIPLDLIGKVWQRARLVDAVSQRLYGRDFKPEPAVAKRWLTQLHQFANEARNYAIALFHIVQQVHSDLPGATV